MKSFALTATAAVMLASQAFGDEITPIPAPPPVVSSGTLVNRDNFIRAETDRMFSDFLKLSGGVNQFAHFRRPVPLDEQTVVRMNRDVIYSVVIVDTSGGATITMPPAPDGRYMSMHLIDNDHYDLGAFNNPGPHALPEGVGHIAAIFRIQVFDPNDEAEIGVLNAWQDGLKLEAGSNQPFVPEVWDTASLDLIRDVLEIPCREFPNFELGMMPRGEAAAGQRLCAASAGWGLLPASQATYFSYPAGHPIAECRTAIFEVPKNGAFWSIQVYGATGFIESENSNLNSRWATLNDDGTFTAFFGSPELCGEVPNRVDVTEGWNFMFRVYLPDPETVLGGRYTLPETVPVQK